VLCGVISVIFMTDSNSSFREFTFYRGKAEWFCEYEKVRRSSHAVISFHTLHCKGALSICHMIGTAIFGPILIRTAQAYCLLSLMILLGKRFF